MRIVIDGTTSDAECRRLLRSLLTATVDRRPAGPEPAPLTCRGCGWSHLARGPVCDYCGAPLA